MRACSGGGGRGQKVPIWRNVSRETLPAGYRHTQEPDVLQSDLALNGPEVVVIEADFSLVRPEYPARLLPNAKVAENHVQDVFDIDPAGQPAERAGGDAQLFSQQILSGSHVAALSPP